MNKFFYLSIIISSTLALSNEVSVFGAGNLNSSNPYGLSSAEKHILKNKKELGSIDTKVKTVKSTIDSINERIDGLESIYEGDSQRLNSSVIKLNEMITNTETTNNQLNKNTQDIEDVKKVVNQLLSMQEEISLENKKNIDSLKLAIESLTKLVNEINLNYISTNEFKSNMKQFVTKNEYNTKTVKSSSSNKKSSLTNDFSKSAKKDLLVEAKNLFKKDNFTKAIPILSYLVEKNYKPAESNFYLGEIYFYRKKYKTAIGYFKTSAMLYDKASWMPKLLLHSAVSFEKTKDIENASSFYNTLIDVYPDSSEAKIASENLHKIN